MELAELAAHDGYMSLAMGRVERGQAWTSTRKLAAHVGMSKTTIRRALRQLVAASEVRCLPTRQGTLVTMIDEDEKQVEMFAAEGRRVGKTAHQTIVDIYFEVYEKLYDQRPRWSPQQGKALRVLLKESNPGEIERRLRLAGDMWTERNHGKALTFGAFARNFDAFVRRPAQRNAFAAWEALSAVIKKYGFRGGATHVQALEDKGIWEAVGACGGYHYVCHTNTNKIRSAFFKEYKGLSHRE